MALKTSQSGMECWLYTTVICEIPSWQKGAIENLPFLNPARHVMENQINFVHLKVYEE